MCNRFLKFYRSLIKSDNSTIKVLLCHAIYGSGSSVANNINLLWRRYKIDKINFYFQEEKRYALQATSTPDQDLIRTAGNINEFVSVRDSLPISNIDRAVWIGHQDAQTSRIFNIFMYCANDYVKLWYS